MNKKSDCLKRYLFCVPTTITGTEYVCVYAASYDEALKRVINKDVDEYLETEEREQTSNWMAAIPCGCNTCCHGRRVPNEENTYFCKKYDRFIEGYRSGWDCRGYGVS